LYFPQSVLFHTRLVQFMFVVTEMQTYERICLATPSIL